MLRFRVRSGMENARAKGRQIGRPQVGKEDILIKTHNHLSVDPDKIKCDAFDYEKGIVSEINSFRGEYMSNYSWAEFKTGIYVAMEQNRR